MIQLTLPPPPSINHYYRAVRGRIFINKHGLEYREVVNRVVHRLNPNAKPLRKRLTVAIRYCPADRRRRDLDNVLKPLLDALQKAGVFKDDEQIDDLRIHRGPVVPGGRVEIQLWENK